MDLLDSSAARLVPEPIRPGLQMKCEVTWRLVSRAANFTRQKRRGDAARSAVGVASMYFLQQ